MFLFRAKHIFEDKKGLKFINGKLKKILEPGLHFEFNLPFRQCRIDIVDRCKPLKTEYCELPGIIDHPILKDKTVLIQATGDKSNKLYFKDIYIRDLPKGNYYFWADDESKITIESTFKENKE